MGSSARHVSHRYIRAAGTLLTHVHAACHMPSLFAKLFLTFRQIAVIYWFYLRLSLLTTLLTFPISTCRGNPGSASTIRLTISAPVQLVARNAVPHTTAAGHGDISSSSAYYYHWAAIKQDQSLSLWVWEPHSVLHSRHEQHAREQDISHHWNSWLRRFRHRDCLVCAQQAAVSSAPARADEQGRTGQLPPWCLL